MTTLEQIQFLLEQRTKTEEEIRAAEKESSPDDRNLQVKWEKLSKIEEKLNETVDAAAVRLAEEKIAACQQEIANYEEKDRAAFAEKRREIDRLKIANGCSLPSWKYKDKAGKCNTIAGWFLVVGIGAIVIAAILGLNLALGLNGYGWAESEVAGYVAESKVYLGMCAVALAVAVLIFVICKKNAASFQKKVELIAELEIGKDRGVQQHTKEISNLKAECEEMYAIIRLTNPEEQRPRIVSLNQCVKCLENYIEFVRFSESVTKMSSCGDHWLFMEWYRIAEEIKSESHSLGFYDLIKENSTFKNVEIVVSKLYSATKDVDLNRVTYRDLMHLAKTKAIEDWVECQRSLDNISDMLTQMFKSK